jgi:hypothetical protein
MRQGHDNVTPAAIRAHAQLLCQQHVRLQDLGPKYTAGMLWTILCYAAYRITSIAASPPAMSRARLWPSGRSTGTRMCWNMARASSRPG